VKFFWIFSNQLVFVAFSRYLPYRGAGDCRFEVRYERHKLANALRNTRLQMKYDAAFRECPWALLQSGDE
jgi:hypothetical protein